MSYYLHRNRVTIWVHDMDDPDGRLVRKVYPEEGYTHIVNYSKVREGQGWAVEFEQVPINPVDPNREISKFAKDVESD